MSDETAVEQLKSELRDAATNWRDQTRRIGEILNQLVELGEPARILQEMLGEFGISLAMSEVAMRWARGDFGDDVSAKRLVSKVRSSVLSKLSPEAITPMLTHSHRILSGQAVVSKDFDQMSRVEVNRNVGMNGFIPITQQVTKQPTFRYCDANDYEQDSKGNVFLLSKGRSEFVRMKVPRKMLPSLVKALKNSRARVKKTLAVSG